METIDNRYFLMQSNEVIGDLHVVESQMILVSLDFELTDNLLMY